MSIEITLPPKMVKPVRTNNAFVLTGNCFYSGFINISRLRRDELACRFQLALRLRIDLDFHRAQNPHVFLR